MKDPMNVPTDPTPSPCECVVCCGGEHAGRCANCAGWGEIGGVPCEACFDPIAMQPTGVCPVCDGESGPLDEEDDADDAD